MAIADAMYKFIYIDVGCNGRVSDGGVFNKCSFAKAMAANKLSLPNPEPLPGRQKPVPFVLVADDAFALKPNVMKPFPGRDLSATARVHNYRLSRARRVVENAFGILSARFRVFRKPINLDASKTKRVTLAACALHNFLIERSPTYLTGMADRYGSDGKFVPGQWRQGDTEDPMQGTEELPSPYTPENAKEIRQEFESYFVSATGELSWQYQHI